MRLFDFLVEGGHVGQNAERGGVLLQADESEVEGEGQRSTRKQVGVSAHLQRCVFLLSQQVRRNGGRLGEEAEKLG